MKDIPVFTTENGAAGLTLREIPRRQLAWITIHASESPEALLQDCTGFCRACGAEKIYASGHPFLQRYPLHAAVLRMSGSLQSLPETDAALFPVQEQTALRWRDIYNESMAQVDHAAMLSAQEVIDAARAGEAYFVHRSGKLLGIGSVCGGELKAMASVVPGSGREVLAALAHAMTGDRITLEVASTNRRAIRLYESLGLLAVAEKTRWYQIF